MICIHSSRRSPPRHLSGASACALPCSSNARDDRRRTLHHPASGDCCRRLRLSVWAWLLGAAIAVADGLVWAELGAAFPRAGGSYAFLREIYGPDRAGNWLSFLYVWQLSFSAPSPSPPAASDCRAFSPGSGPALETAPIAALQRSALLKLRRCGSMPVGDGIALSEPELCHAPRLDSFCRGHGSDGRRDRIRICPCC